MAIYSKNQLTIGDQARGSIKKKNTVLDNILKHRALYFMALPGLLWYLIFKYLPMMGSIIAFQDYNLFKGFSGSPFVGLKHFKFFMQYPEFFRILRNTLVIGLYDIIFSFPAPIILALLLNEITKNSFKRTIQTLVYIPHFLSWVVIGGIFMNTILSPDAGIINYFLKILGFDPIFFMSKPSYIRSILITSGIWKDIGYGTIVYLAAIAGINPNLYEASSVDGASRLRQVFVITIPSIMSVVVVMLLLRIGHFMDFGFERVYVFLSGINQDAAEIFDTYIYRVGLQGSQFSYSTAVGLFKSVVGLVLLLVSNFLSKKLADKSLF